MKGHSADHFEKTMHNYSLELETRFKKKFFFFNMNIRRVWDYSGDGYVHRLIASKGGITEIPRPKGIETDSNDVFSNEIVEVEFVNKMDFICQEYNQLLSQQLDSQRIYFERKIRDSTKELESNFNELEKNFKEIEIENKKNLKKIEVTNTKLKKTNEEKELLKNVKNILIKILTNQKKS